MKISAISTYSINNSKYQKNNIVSFKSNQDSQKLNMFIAMPMKGDDWFEDTKETIKDVAKSNNIEAFRIDDRTVEGSITDEIFRSISDSEIVVADLTNENANVFLEVGYAIAKKELAENKGNDKKIIPIIRKGHKLPFDIQHLNTIFYRNNIDLRMQLDQRIKHSLANLKKLVKGKDCE